MYVRSVGHPESEELLRNMLQAVFPKDRARSYRRALIPELILA